MNTHTHSQPRRPRFGFSLIELAVVLIVIGVIAAVAIPTFHTVIDRSRDRATEASASAVLRAATATAVFDERFDVTLDDIEAAVAELGVVASAPGVFAEQEQWEFRSGVGEYSDTFGVVHAGITTQHAGLALRSPTGNCSFAIGSIGGAVRTWTAPVDSAQECAAQYALPPGGDTYADTLELTLHPGSGQIVASWNAVDGANEYALTLDGDPVTVVTATTFTFTGLGNGSTYTVGVTARNNSGDSPEVTKDATLAPNAPAPTLTPLSTSIGATWPAVAGATLYVVYLDGVEVATTATTSHTFEGLAQGTEYEVSVVARNSGGDSPPGVATSTTSPGTTTLTLTSGAGQLSAAWPAVPGALEYAVSVDGGAEVVVTTTNHVISGLTHGETYTVAVTARNAAGSGDPATAIGTVPPAQVTSVTITPGNAQLAVSWPASHGATSYTVSVNGTTVSTVTGTSAALTGLGNGTTYTVGVVASNAGGNSPVRTTTGMPRTVPSPITTLVVNSVGDRAATISWTPPFNGGMAITGYTVSYMCHCDNVWRTLSTGSPSLTITGLNHFISAAPLANYTFQVTSTNAVGTSATSNAAVAHNVYTSVRPSGFTQTTTQYSGVLAGTPSAAFSAVVSNAGTLGILSSGGGYVWNSGYLGPIQTYTVGLSNDCRLMVTGPGGWGGIHWVSGNAATAGPCELRMYDNGAGHGVLAIAHPGTGDWYWALGW